MKSNHAYESKFQKFYLLRIIQLLEQKTFKTSFKLIKLYANTQPKIKTIDNVDAIKTFQVYDGETYISKKEYSRVLQLIPKLESNINLFEYLNKKLESIQKQKFASVKETMSQIKYSNQKQYQVFLNKRVPNQNLSVKSKRKLGQDQINKPPQVKKKQFIKMFSIYLLFPLFIIFIFMSQIIVI